MFRRPFSIVFEYEGASRNLLRDCEIIANLRLPAALGQYSHYSVTLQRPTPPHLTSVLAEQMLARACENEAENAKRMRMGLEPVSQSLPAAVVSSAALDSVGGAGGGYRADQLVSLLAQAGSCSGAGGGHNGVPARPSAQVSTGHSVHSRAGPNIPPAAPLLQRSPGGGGRGQEERSALPQAEWNGDNRSAPAHYRWGAMPL